MQLLLTLASIIYVPYLHLTQMLKRGTQVANDSSATGPGAEPSTIIKSKLSVVGALSVVSTPSGSRAGSEHGGLVPKGAGGKANRWMAFLDMLRKKEIP